MYEYASWNKACEDEHFMYKDHLSHFMLYVHAKTRIFRWKYYMFPNKDKKTIK